MPPPRVVAIPAVTERVSENLALIGSVAANEIVEVRSEAEGVIQGISFEEGQHVEKGQLLARLDESKFAAAVAEGEANLRLSRANFERAEQLHREQLISQQEFDQSRSSFESVSAAVDLNRRLLKDARIYAPFAGTAGERRISPGQVISKNSILTWIVDLDPVKVEFDVPERFVSQVQTNQQISITVAAYPGRTFAGNVFFVSPFVDLTNRTALVKAQIPNPKGELKPGMFANLNLTMNVRESAIVIPEVAVAQTLEGGRALVFVIDAQTNAMLRPVKLGLRMEGRVEVDGVKPGELVIVEGTQKTVPGKPVRLAPPEAGAIYQRAGQPAAQLKDKAG